MKKIMILLVLLSSLVLGSDVVFYHTYDDGEYSTEGFIDNGIVVDGIDNDWIYNNSFESFTAIAMIKPYSTAQGYIMHKDKMFLLQNYKGNLQAGIYRNGISWTPLFTVPVSVDTNEWNFVAFSWNNSNGIYTTCLNNECWNGDTSYSTINNNYPITIGERRAALWGSYRRFNGAIDETGLFSDAKSVDEIIIIKEKLDLGLHYLADDEPIIEPEEPLELRIDYNFDSGALQSYEINGDDVRLWLFSDPQGNAYNLHFNITNCTNRTVNFEIMNEVEWDYTEDTESPTQLVYSCGNGWNRLTDTIEQSGIYRFSHAFECNNAEISTVFAYSMENINKRIDYMHFHPLTQVETLGDNNAGANIRKIIISDTSITTDKNKVYMIARQHPGETHGSFLMDGMMDEILSNPELTQNIEWHFVPSMNPIGIGLGYTRSDEFGNDLNRQWEETTSWQVNAVKDDLASVGYGIDLFIDSHGLAHGQDYMKLLSFTETSIGTNLYNDQQGLVTMLDENTFFNYFVESGVYTPMARSHFISTYGGIGLSFEPGQHNTSMTIAKLEEEGANIAITIGDYFGVSIPPEPEPMFQVIMNGIVIYETPNAGVEITIGEDYTFMPTTSDIITFQVT